MGRIALPVRWTRLFLQLTWVEQRELIVVICLAVWCETLVRWRPLPELARRFKVGLGSNDSTLEDKPLESLPPWAIMRLRMVRRVMRNWPVEGVCLRHTLVAGHRVSALDPTLHIGVAMSDPGVLEAHAWLEIDGRSLDVESRNYERLSLS
jgi:hypothetical protein